MKKLLFTVCFLPALAQDRMLAPEPPPLLSSTVDQVTALLEFAAGQPVSAQERLQFRNGMVELWAKSPAKDREAFIALGNLQPQIRQLPEIQRIELRSKLLLALQQFAPRQQGAATAPASAIPAELVGKWSTVSTSNVGFVNSTTGSWSAPSGDASMYELHPDGSFDYYGMIQSSMYNCTMTITPHEKGVVHIRGNQLSFDSAGGSLESKDNCNREFNYTKPLPANQKTYTWRVTRDEYGIKLCMAGQGGQESCLYRK